MRFEGINDVDLKLILLSGEPLHAGDTPIYPISVRDIVKVGYTNYSMFLNIVTITIDKLIDLNKVEDVEKIKQEFTTFDIILSSDREDLVNLFIEAMKFFFQVDKFRFRRGSLILGDDIVINSENFNEFVQIIKLQNYMENPNERANPKDEKAKSIMERLKKAQEKIAKKNGNKESESKIEFPDIVSAVSTKSNHWSKQNVWDLTVYQLYDEFKRLEVITGYETGVLAMVNGADIELKHWSSKLD